MAIRNVHQFRDDKEKYRRYAQKPNEMRRLFKRGVSHEILFFTILRICQQGKILAVFQYLLKLIVGKCLLQIILVDSLPGKMTVALSWWVRFYYASMRDTQRNPQLPLHSTEVMPFRNFQMREIVLILIQEVFVRLLSVILFTLV